MKDKIVKELQQFFSSVQKKKAVVGLSGGIDSAVTLSLTVLALGKENVTAIFMPEVHLTSDQNKDDALHLAKSLGVAIETVPINSFIDASRHLPWLQSRLAAINLKPRIRMMILYHYANAHDAIVVGTSNKSEIYLGYGTKHGDCAADILPIGDLYKGEVIHLAKELGIPYSIISKKPSAELYPGQTDEDEMGITYHEADAILQDHLDYDIRKEQLVEKYGEKNVNLVFSRMSTHEHKRVLPTIIKKSKTGLFIGRFQPFHLGHLDAIKQIAKECDTIIIAIGSAQYASTPDNPLSYQERKKLIEEVLGNRWKYTLFPVEDVHQAQSWVEHINLKVPKYDYVFTSNGFVEDLFSEQGIPVKRLKFNVKISGEEIRNMINERNENWKQFVPREAVKYFNRKNVHI